ncbi:G patch domain and KOW motifs-containing protein [Marchantia polymorpha subsp. ruderalis]|uniref:G-patch domain-containing protein n=2 Tax=Marchantia polymorpha TaxID=3197 RepID=A0AAF6BF37_MARPO|nr:hypothetical protein MARPO_0027s0115 [Marchantia polymorpha]PTQ43013.1 hypothetical protein MARPO_0027s0115 [Marchantia polymorpha]BBN10621.1 hypothetical protein Mp_5g05110 [Marchantia polymorpha subsp. ruderalis]BBN10622.1 hypothetical protein Mp_5g05110 [Marchantia polymorpha subsp. ruderalis]|eukprot:PTQ43012.1 hypothetical protein MARPO_0027s0115 [Marchantia polymorpha]
MQEGSRGSPDVTRYDSEDRAGIKELEPGAPVKFSFTASKPKFSASRPPLFPKGKQRSSDDESKDMEYVTGFDQQGIVAKDPKGRLGVRVIPKLENSYRRPEKRMKNIMMETDVMDSTDVRFEKELDTVLAGAISGAQYGLTIGVKKMETVEMTTTVSTEKDPNGQRTTETTVAEDYMEHTTLSFSQIEEQRLKKDLTLLPDEADLDAYEEMPVEDFGEAMLRGMGWEKGKPIGRNSKDVIVPVEYVRRSGRTGLGADSAPKEVSSKKYIKPGESRSAAPELVAALGPDGRTRNVISVDEKLVERIRKGVARGKVMSIISGRHLGLRGEVLDVLDSERVSVKLVKSAEKVVVSAAELADIGSLEEEKVLKQIRQLKIGNGEASQDSSIRDDSPPDRREDKKHERNEDRRERVTRRDDGSKAHYRREEEERVRSRRDSRRDERGEYEEPKRSSREGRKDSKRDESDRAGDEMEVDDEGRNRRSEDRRKPSRYHKRDDRRDDGRRESRKDGRRDDERSQPRSYRERGDVSERERAGRDRRDASHISQDRAEKDRSNSGDRDLSGVASGGRITEPWLMSQIRVRVISKTLKGGKLYLKKARIVDVVSPRECDILMDESGEMLQQVKQEQLETALPKKGGRIVVVGGTEYRGKMGKLLERGSEKGLVQMEENFKVETMDLDLLAEFVGDPSELDD